MAFRKLPFQYQQRGQHLARAFQDAPTLATLTESRDQDLENYLAGLGGGASVAAWSATTVDGGGSSVLAPAPGVPDWSSASTIGKFSVSGPAATYTGAGNVLVLQVATTVLDPTASTLSGLIRITVPGSAGTHLLAVDTGASATQGVQDVEVTAFGPGLVLDPTVGGTGITATPTNMGIAGVTGPDSVNLQFIQLIAVVWPID